MFQFSAVSSLLFVSIGIESSAVGLKICAITARIQKYESIIMEKRKKCNKMVLLAKTKLNNIEVLISRDLVESYISHDEIISVNKVLEEYGDMKDAIKNLKTLTVHQIFQSIYKTMLCFCLKCRKIQKVKTQRLERMLMLLSKCVVFDSTKLKLMKEQKVEGLLSMTGKILTL